MARNTLRQTETEQLAQRITSADLGLFNMDEHNLENVIEKEKIKAYNAQYEELSNELAEQEKAIKECQDSVVNKLEKLEIKPTNNRLLVKPFAYNPFQKMEVKNGIITDIGGLNPDIEFNRDTGEYQEREQHIKVAVVVEVGPEVKYAQVGDTIFCLKNVLYPIPFFKQGLWLVKEDNLMAIVNDNFEERF